MEAAPVLPPRAPRFGAPSIIRDRLSRPDAAASGPSIAGLPDEEARRIVAAVLDGDAEAFNVLVRREASNLVRVCHRVLGDLHDAEDAAQDAFVIAYRALGTWRGDGPFGAWLARIGVRVALRHAGRRRRVAWLDPLGSAGEPGFDLAAAEHLEPAAQALRGERRERVRRALRTLKDPYREVVALRFFAELSLDEIAAQTGRPLGTVKTHLHRGLARLRIALEGEAE